MNAPEYFASSTSSHFFQYLTGWIKADFIDLVDEDVIATNRQSVNWDHPEMSKLRDFLSTLIMDVGRQWRDKRTTKKDSDFKDSTGIDKEKWISTLPSEVKKSVEKIVNTMSRDEEVAETYVPIIKALHDIVPEYPLLHWRHLNVALRNRIKNYYENRQYGEAADQGIKIFCEEIRKITGLVSDGTQLTGDAFGGNTPRIIVADIATESGSNIQKGQDHLSRGLIQGFRNPINHSPIDSVVPSIFTELDCLNILSLISYLMTKLENRRK